jgi:hypothetical protein
MNLRWSQEKANELKCGRDIDVHHLADLMREGEQIDSFPNPQKPHQTVFIFNINNYALVAICVPDSENERGLFLKTAYLSREHTKFYLRKT